MIRDKLRKKDILTLTAPTGRTFAEELKIAANYLADCIQKHIDDFYESYTPRVYDRTLELYSSLSVDDIADIRISYNVLSISLRFDEGANHKSLFGEEVVNTAYLMNYGYQVIKDVWFKDVEYFGWRNGFFFVEKGIEDFNKTNSLGIQIKIEKPRSYYV